ncbi:hypothetical protein [Laspinema palackyanum]|nr:hypothetical protein [Laspinema sp. D2c]
MTYTEDSRRSLLSSGCIENPSVLICGFGHPMSCIRQQITASKVSKWV